MQARSQRIKGTYTLKRVLPNWTVPKDIEGEWTNAKNIEPFGMVIAYFDETLFGFVRDGDTERGPRVWFPRGGVPRHLLHLTEGSHLPFSEFLSLICRQAKEVYHYSTICGDILPQFGEISGRYKRSNSSPVLGSPRTGRHHNYETGEENRLA